MLVVLLLACGKQSEWKERSGPDFVVAGPYAPRKFDQPVPGTTATMTIYEFGNSVTEATCTLVVEPYSKQTKVVDADVRRYFDSLVLE